MSTSDVSIKELAARREWDAVEQRVRHATTISCLGCTLLLCLAPAPETALVTRNQGNGGEGNGGHITKKGVPETLILTILDRLRALHADRKRSHGFVNRGSYQYRGRFRSRFEKAIMGEMLGLTKSFESLPQENYARHLHRQGWPTVSFEASFPNYRVFIKQAQEHFSVCMDFDACAENINAMWSNYCFGQTINVQSLRSVSNLYELEHEAIYQDLAALYHKTEFLLDKIDEGVANHDNVPFNQRPRVHALIQMGFPLILIWFWIKMKPEEGLEKDELGRVPLHYALSYYQDYYAGTLGELLNNSVIFMNAEFTPCWDTMMEEDPRFANTDELTMMRTYSNCPCQCIRAVLSCAPSAASVSDHKGRIPLALLLENGLPTKSDNRRDDEVHCDKNNVRLCAVRALVKAGPAERVLAWRDPESKLFPFMMGQHVDMDTAYTLIREHPTMIEDFIVRTNYEKYLEKRLHDAEESIQELNNKLQEEQKSKRIRLA
jgi:hypothetical protein